MRVLVRLALGMVVLGALSAPGMARAESGSCPTWFPDLDPGCEREGRWEGFERPIVAPFMFEDPFITTDLQAWYLFHEFPEPSATGGGNVQAVALQARIAITDRLAFIATKDGYVWQDRDSPLLNDAKGWLNLAGGLKYALIVDEARRFILSPALRIEASTGASDVFEGGSSAILIPSVSAAWGVGDAHFIAGLGGHVPFDGAKYSSLAFYHLYADYKVAPHFQPFVQLSGLHYIESGNGMRTIHLKGAEVPLATVEGLVGDFEGVDVHNLGAKGVDNHDIITGAVGAHVPISRKVTLSAAYERPITTRKDIFKQRVTASLRLAF